MPLFVILDLSSVPPNGLRTFTTTVSGPAAGTLVLGLRKPRRALPVSHCEKAIGDVVKGANVADFSGAPNRPRNDMAMLHVCPGCRGLLSHERAGWPGRRVLCGELCSNKTVDGGSRDQETPPRCARSVFVAWSRRCPTMHMETAVVAVLIT